MIYVYGNVFRELKEQSCCLFSLKISLSLLGFLMIKEVNKREWHNGVFIESNKRLGDRKSLPLKRANRRFRSATTNCRLNRRIESQENRGTTTVSFDGFMAVKSNRRSETEIFKSIRSHRRFWSAIGVVDHNHRIIPKTSRIKRQFHLTAKPPITIVVSLKVVKPKEKPREFSEGDPRAN